MQAENITPIQDFGEIQLQYGEIQSGDERIYQVVTRSGSYRVTPAFSCLVRPMPGDRVLFSAGPSASGHILSVIERIGSTDTGLDFPGDVTLSAGQGALQLQAQHGVNTISAQGISQVAESYTLVTKKALFKVDDLTAIGSTLVSKIRQVRTIADRVETVAGQWLQKLTNSFRTIEGVDQLRAKDSLHWVENLYSMHSKQAAILAKKDIKVDAERIHMG